MKNFSRLMIFTFIIISSQADAWSFRAMRHQLRSNCLGQGIACAQDFRSNFKSTLQTYRSDRSSALSSCVGSGTFGQCAYQSEFVGVNNRLGRRDAVKSFFDNYSYTADTSTIAI